MTSIEKKARVIVKEAYFDYKVSRSQYAYNVYSSKMEMLEQLFPITTNQENLENRWDIEWKKENY